jgi:hypothetical protein
MTQGNSTALFQKSSGSESDASIFELSMIAKQLKAKDQSASTSPFSFAITHSKCHPRGSAIALSPWALTEHSG